MRVADFSHRYLFEVLAIFLLFSTGCPSKLEPDVCRDFFAKPSTPRLLEFANYDLSKQMTIHQCGINRMPPTDYSSEIASRGDVIVPDLLVQMGRDDFANRYDADLNKLGAILVFRRLAATGNFAANPENVFAIERSVLEIRTDWMRYDAENAFVEIRRGLEGNLSPTR